MTDHAPLLRFHEQLVATPSPSHEEGAIADLVEGWLQDRGATVDRVGDNVIARAGSGPRIILCSHLDTVPATEAWTRDPWSADRDGDRIYGLGSNDAKASVAAMTFAFLDVLENGGPCEVALLLVPEEETGGKGAEVSWPHLREHGFSEASVIVGEPTDLDIATSQKGLLILELTATGDGCHAANAAAAGARNAVRALAQDVVALGDVDLGLPHSQLGSTTLEPTVTSAGQRRNMIPDRATTWLDVRTVPGVAHADIIAAVRAQVEGDVRVHSDRLQPCECPDDAAIIAAAKLARPDARAYGSRTMSDMVWFSEVPAIKCGPGCTERSHTANEFVLETEIVDGYAFYAGAIRHFAEVSR
jgi:acetylornithine deacetylase